MPKLGTEQQISTYLSSRFDKLYWPIMLSVKREVSFNALLPQIDELALKVAQNLRDSLYLAQGIEAFQTNQTNAYSKVTRNCTEQHVLRMGEAIDAFCLGVRKHAGLASVALAVIAGGWLFAKSGGKTDA